MSIYKPTWLYIKQHNQTGLKYFGKTISKDPYKYKGSGTYWKRHLAKHGNDVTTIWCKIFESEEKLTEYALTFSKENNIVRSPLWANQVPESGVGGNVPGAGKGRVLSAEHTHNIRQFKLSEAGKEVSSKGGKAAWKNKTNWDNESILKRVATRKQQHSYSTDMSKCHSKDAINELIHD